LAGGTTYGRVGLWKYSPSPGAAEPEDQWQTQTPSSVTGPVLEVAVSLFATQLFIGVILRGYEGYTTPPPTLGHSTPTFMHHKRPSFQLKLFRNVWAAGALPRTPLGLTDFPDPLARLRVLFVKGRGGKQKERSGEGEERGVKGGNGTSRFLGRKLRPMHLLC